MAADDEGSEAIALLGTAFGAIERERSLGRYDEAFHAVQAVVDTFGEDGLAERVYAATSNDMAWNSIADLLSIASWQTSDNGSQIMRTAERWLRETNEDRKAMVALHLEAYPFADRYEMERVLHQVAQRLPRTGARCDELIAMRRRGPEEGSDCR